MWCCGEWIAEIHTDPLDLRADSRLGVVGLVEVLRRGAATVVNTLGSGILESPGLMRFLPDLARLLLGETPLLDTAPMYWGGIDRERSHLLTHLSSLLVKSTLGGETIVGPTLSAGQQARLAARASRTRRGSGWARNCRSSPPRPPTTCRADSLRLPVGMRLFAVSQRDSYAPMIGGLGYVLAPGVGAYTFNTVAPGYLGASADKANAEVMVSSVEAPRSCSRCGLAAPGRQFPRVFSDLFWMGRYGERSEQMACC